MPEASFTLKNVICMKNLEGFINQAFGNTCKHETKSTLKQSCLKNEAIIFGNLVD